MDTDTTPEPYRSPLGWYNPTVSQRDGEVEVTISIPNEDPDTEDDLTLNLKFTREGVITDLMVSDGEVIGTRGDTYDEIAEGCY
jgi:hypothetical protein